MDQIISFFNSNFFVGLVTLVAGVAAYLIYRKQKTDNKRDAANIILLEIQSAERIMAQVGPSVRAGTLLNKFLLPADNWSKYKYLFVRDFDRDEWDRISEFYNNSKLYDEAVLYNNSLFQKNEEQIRINMLKAPAEYIKEYIDGASEANEVEEQKRFEEAFAKANLFQTKYLSRIASLFYSPQKPITDAKNAFESLSDISHTTIGSKLKALAGLKS